MTPLFILPSDGNQITFTDIEEGRLRITVDFKHFFPSSSQKVFVRVGVITKEVSLRFRENRSHVLQIGQELMQKLELTEGNRVCFEILGVDSFRISKLVP